MKADYNWFLEDFFYYLAVIYYYIVMYFDVNVNTIRRNQLFFIFIEVINSADTQLGRSTYTVFKVTSLSSMLVGCMYNKFSARWFTSKKYQTTKHDIRQSYE